MRKSTLIGLFAIWAGINTTGFAQVSTFPSPPPLAPSPDQSSDSTTNNALGTPSAPPIDSSVSPASSGGSSYNSSSGMTGSPSGNTTGGNVSPNPVSPGTGPSSFSTPPTEADPNETPITAATLNSMSALDDKVTLEAGDRISFRVIEDRDDAVPRLVTDTGEVDFPYVGRLKVAGLTCRQVALQLKKLLEVDYYKSATVIVGLDVIVGHATTEEAHDVAWIVGQVRQVGPQDLPKLQPMTVSQIILRAGGFGDFADERRVRVVHRPTTSAAMAATPGEVPNANDAPGGEVVDVKSVFQGHSTFDPIVKPNDLIIVPKRVFNL